MADLVIPKLGESISEAVIAKWLKNVGETVAVDEPLVDLETDKVSVALPSPTAGVLAEQRFAAGDTVKVGEVIGVITPGAETTTGKGDGNGSAAKAKAPAKAPAATPRAEAAALAETGAIGQPTPAPAKKNDAPKVIGGVVEQMEPAPRGAKVPPVQTAGQEPIDEHVVPHSKTLPPSVRKAIREGAHYETPTLAQARGPEAQPQQARAPQPPPVAGDREEVVAMSPLRKRIAQRLVEAQHTAAITSSTRSTTTSASPSVAARAWWCRWCATSTRCRSPASRRRSRGWR